MLAATDNQMIKVLDLRFGPPLARLRFGVLSKSGSHKFFRSWDRFPFKQKNEARGRTTVGVSLPTGGTIFL